MTNDELETTLRAWGRAYGERPPAEWEEDRTLTGTHALVRAAEFAPGRKVRHLDLAYRRRVRAGERPWSRDPIICTETRSSGASSVGSGSVFAVAFTPQVERVQTAVMAIRRESEAVGLVLEAQYCKRGTQREKAAWVSGMGHRMVVRTYRRHLVSGRELVAQKIA